MNKDRLQMYESLTKITIVLCWLSLFSFWAIKLFGGNWFEIIVENDNFVKISKYIEETWLRYLSSFVTIFIARYLTFGAVCQKFIFKGKLFVIIVCCIISMWSVANFVNNEIIRMLYGYIVIFIIGLIFQKGRKRLFGIVAVFFDLAFSSISMITRNIQLQFVTDYLTLFILGIDIYIMYSLYYLYSNLKKIKKEK
jgi:hypothetical protein